MSLFRPTILLFLIGLALGGGCGQKGPLMMPPEAAPTTTTK